MNIKTKSTQIAFKGKGKLKILHDDKSTGEIEFMIEHGTTKNN